MATVVRTRHLVLQAVSMAWLAGCASTSVTLQPSLQAPMCDPTATALVIWSPVWRTDQKDMPLREEAAAAGLRDFLSQSGCFAKAELRRVENLQPATVAAQIATAAEPFTVVAGVEVRELGPVVKLLSSVALVDGGTEVVLRLVEFAPGSATERRHFTVHWQNGGAGVVKGVGSLPSDMQAALRAGFKPAISAK